jgi:hypothetical protein
LGSYHTQNNVSARILKRQGEVLKKGQVHQQKGLQNRAFCITKLTSFQKVMGLYIL